MTLSIYNAYLVMVNILYFEIINHSNIKNWKKMLLFSGDQIDWGRLTVEWISSPQSVLRLPKLHLTTTLRFWRRFWRYWTGLIQFVFTKFVEVTKIYFNKGTFINDVRQKGGERLCSDHCHCPAPFIVDFRRSYLLNLLV